VGKLLQHVGVGNVILCDSHGAIYDGRQEDMNWAKLEVAKYTNKEHKRGSLADVIKGADVFIGLSAPKALNQDMIKSMANDPIVMALALPVPEITYQEAKSAGAKVVATGRSDSPNQISSAIAAPGIFRGALDVRASEINKEMLVAAAHAMAELVEDDELSPQYVLPRVLDFRTAPAIAKAVAQSAIKTNVARFKADPDVIERKTLEYIYEGEENAWVDPPSHEELDDKTPIGIRSIQMHKRHHGVIEVKAKLPIKDNYIYDLAYASPGAAEPCKLIHENKDKIYDLTCKNNMVAVVTDGTAVLGLGDIGATAGLPVMEGKAVLFKTLGGVEAFPICVGTKDIDEIVRIVQLIEPVFGGVNLEDISAPSCFEVEEKLKKIVDIPIFHDDQHGTAVVVLAGLLNALKFAGKSKEKVKVVMNGAGASSIAVCKLLLADGFKNIIMCDTKGAIYKGRKEGMNSYKEVIANQTNLEGIQGKLVDVLKGADVFIGLSKG
ncbi:MAG: malic enzyme-like NAD(P)-binding protein, partial [Pseudomonadota bacterium]